MCPSKALTTQAEPEQELLPTPINRAELTVYMNRLNKANDLNTTDMFVVPSAGQVYLFKLSPHVTIDQNRKALMHCDDYVWYNNHKTDKTLHGYLRTYYVNKDKDGKNTKFNKKLYIHPKLPFGIVEYIGNHTTGMTKPDKYLIDAMNTYHRKEKQKLTKKSQSRLKVDTSSSNDSSQEYEQANPITINEPIPTRPVLQQPQPPQSFDATIRAALDPMRHDIGQVIAALPKYTNVSTPGVMPNYLYFDNLIQETHDSLFDDYRNCAIVQPQHGDIYLFHYKVPDAACLYKDKKKKNKTISHSMV